VSRFEPPPKSNHSNHKIPFVGDASVCCVRAGASRSFVPVIRICKSVVDHGAVVESSVGSCAYPSVLVAPSLQVQRGRPSRRRLSRSVPVHPYSNCALLTPLLAFIVITVAAAAATNTTAAGASPGAAFPGRH
jgi:hypothetical protein